MNEVHSSRWLRWRRRISCSLAQTLPQGVRLLPATTPAKTVRHRFPLGAPKTLLVFLPGIDDLPGDFLKHGLADTAWRAGFPADVVEADIHLGYYLRATVVERLHEDVVRVARAQGYERIWLVGISLGGLGALLYARDHADSIDGLVLLAPFVGHRSFIESLQRGGGPHHWQASAGGNFRYVWSWLISPGVKPPIYLGFGDQDRFAPSLRLLTELMLKGRVFVAHGGHDWITWSRLWETILSRVLTQPRHWA